MIKEIIIKNFKSHQSSMMSFGELTLLIGANASGKTNALEALRLLSEIAKGKNLDDLSKQNNNLFRGTVKDLLNKKNMPIDIQCNMNFEEWNKFYISLKIQKDSLIVCEEEIKNENEKIPLYKVKSSAKRYSNEINIAYNNFARGQHKSIIPCSNKQAMFFQLNSISRFEQKHEKSREIIPKVCEKFKKSLSNIIFIEPKIDKMRGYSYINDIDIISSVSNLSSLLYKIWYSKTKVNGKYAKDYLLDFVASLPEQNITNIDFIVTERKDIMVQLEESFGKKKKIIDAPLLSDGTLKSLAIAAVLLSAPKGSFIVIEELDNGIHPSRIKELIDKIKVIAKKRRLQILLTSHNPMLANAIPDEELGKILLSFRENDTGNSKIVKLEEMELYSEMIIQNNIGDLMSSGLLERYLKSDETCESRKVKSLEWIEKNLK